MHRHREERTASAGVCARTSVHLRANHIQPHLGRAPVAPGLGDAELAPAVDQAVVYSSGRLLSPDGRINRRQRFAVTESGDTAAPVTDCGHQPTRHKDGKCRPISFKGEIERCHVPLRGRGFSGNTHHPGRAALDRQRRDVDDLSGYIPARRTAVLGRMKR